MSRSDDLLNHAHSSKCLKLLCSTMSWHKKYNLTDGTKTSTEYRFIDGSGIIIDENGVARLCLDKKYLVEDYV